MLVGISCPTSFSLCIRLCLKNTPSIAFTELFQSDPKSSILRISQNEYALDVLSNRKLVNVAELSDFCPQQVVNESLQRTQWIFYGIKMMEQGSPVVHFSNGDCRCK